MRRFLSITRPIYLETMGTFLQPRTLSEALAGRAAGARVLGGGTDLWPARVAAPLYDHADGAVLDLSRVAGLAGITRGSTGWRIGGLATWTDIATAALPAAFGCLQQAAREIGGRQVQNRGTIGGNLCNASPAADGVPPLLALGAAVELASAKGTRVLPLDTFIVGPRQTALRADEVLTAVLVPEPPVQAQSGYLKLGARRFQLISIAMAAAVLGIEHGRVAMAAVAVGACSPVAVRLPVLEAELVGRAPDELGGLLRHDHLARLAPIDDVRADAGYRLQAAQVLVRRLLTQLAQGH